MQPLARATLLLAGLTALAQAAEHAAARSRPASAHVAPAGAGELPSVCPAGTLPDGDVCVPVPRLPGGGQASALEQGRHRDLGGRWQVYEHLPRRPDRPADFTVYHLPVATRPGAKVVISDYDLDRAPRDQRRTESAVGHGGVDIRARRGAEVRLVPLAHQVGDAEVLFTGDLFGRTVVTRHTLREARQLREYVVLYGHLDEIAGSLAKGTTVKPNQLLGLVGDSGSPGVVHLHLETRRVRDGVNVTQLAPAELVDSARTIVSDPRNVLPLASKR